MTTEDITSLFKTSDRLVSEVSLSHHRYLAGEIDWRNRLVCIKGARGTGKTTLLQQHVTHAFDVGRGKALYFSTDDLWFTSTDLHELLCVLYAHV